MKSKAIFLDLDDTLLNRKKEVSPGNRAAIERALAAGHKVVITTGRPLEASVALSDQLGLTGEGCYLIAFNGSVLFDAHRREIISRIPLPIRYAPPIMAEGARLGLHVQFYDDWHTYVEPRNDGDREILWYCNRIKISYRVLPRVEELTQDPLKLLAISLDCPEKLEAMEAFLDERFAGAVRHFHSCPELVEIVGPGISKGDAVLRLCRMLGVPEEDSIACGDEANDLSMIRAAGLGVAMCNGVAEVRAAADYITENDCDHDGIAEVIERFMLRDR